LETENIPEVDVSPIPPRFKTDIATHSAQTTEKVASEELLEYDVVVRIPPKRSYTIQMRVENIEKGKPVIVEPGAWRI